MIIVMIIYIYIDIVHTYTMLDIFPAYPTTSLVTSMAHHGHHNGSLAGPIYSYSDGRGNDFNISLMVKVTQHAMRDVNHAVRFISRWKLAWYIYIYAYVYTNLWICIYIYSHPGELCWITRERVDPVKE